MSVHRTANHKLHYYTQSDKRHQPARFYIRTQSALNDKATIEKSATTPSKTHSLHPSTPPPLRHLYEQLCADCPLAESHQKHQKKMKTIKLTGCGQKATAQNDSTPRKATFRNCRTLLYSTLLAILALALGSSCSGKDENPLEQFYFSGGSMYVINEGGLGADNSTLSVYNPSTKEVTREVFLRANGVESLGDASCSMTMIGDRAFLTISNSKKIYVIDPHTAILKGKITGLNSPRYIQPISPNKAYVSNLHSSVIDIINPATLEKTGQIDLGAGNRAEQFLMIDGFVYTNTWSSGKKIIKIDPVKDEIVQQEVVGEQPFIIRKDANGKIWALTDGGLDENYAPIEDRSLACVEPTNLSVIKRMTFPASGFFPKMEISKDGRTIYYIAKDVFAVSIDATTLPTKPIIEAGERTLYAIAIDPSNGDIYLSDALTFDQNGAIYRYDKEYKELDNFKAGICPGAFFFIP